MHLVIEAYNLPDEAFHSVRKCPFHRADATVSATDFAEFLRARFGAARNAAPHLELTHSGEISCVEFQEHVTAQWQYLCTSLI